MAQATGTTDTYDLNGLAEDVENVIFNISPMDTYMLTKLKRKSVTATFHQWQTDALAAPGANAHVEGDDSTYAAVSPTTMLGNYTQISKKSLMVSGTADKVRKYGRAKEFAYQIAKKGKEIKRDIETRILGNGPSHEGGSGTARLSAGLESMLSKNAIRPTAASSHTTPGYAGGIWAAPTDGTATATFSESLMLSAIQAAWNEGGDPTLVLLPAFQKRKAAEFNGAAKYDGVVRSQSGKAQAAVVGGVDLYISDFGSHDLRLTRYMRSSTVFALDMEYLSMGFLRPIHFEERAKTGDAERGELLCEWTLIADNPDASAKIADLYSV